MHPAAFERAIPESQRAKTHALDRMATGIGSYSTTAGICHSNVEEVKMSHISGHRFN
jgi:hypothetical protein